MARITFTDRLRHVAPAATVQCEGATLLEVLRRLDEDYPKLLAYIVDEHGRVRKHVAVFIDGTLKRGQTALTEALGADSDVYVMQALSGG